MWWWLTHSLKVGALSVTYGGVTQITQVVVVVALLTWELGQHIIYGASGGVTLTLNMVEKVTQVIIRRRGRRMKAEDGTSSLSSWMKAEDGTTSLSSWMKAEDGTSSLS